MRPVLPWDATRTQPPQLGLFDELLKTNAQGQDNSFNPPRATQNDLAAAQIESR
jgi:hypothetical protein